MFKDDSLKNGKLFTNQNLTNKLNTINSLLQANRRNLDEITQKKMMHKSLNTISAKFLLPNDTLEMLKISPDIIFFAGLGVIAFILLLTSLIICLIVKRKRAQASLYDRFLQNRFLFNSDRTLNSTLSESSQLESNGVQLINFEKRSSSLKMQQIGKTVSFNGASNELVETKLNNCKNKLSDSPKHKKSLFTFKFFNKKDVSLEDTYL